MTDTSTLITSLSQDVSRGTKPRSPAYWGLRVGAVLLLYALGIQAHLGLRLDVLTRLQAPLFLAEILLLFGIAISSATACMLAMYPDRHQRAGWILWPIVLSAALVVLLLVETLLAPDASAILKTPNHFMDCAICIAIVAIMPSAALFWLLRKGATVTRYRAGVLVVLTASAIGCLTLRLAEPSDVLAHLVLGHYLPTVMFSLLGAVLGGKLLRW